MDPDFKAFLDLHGIPDPESVLIDDESLEPLNDEKIRAFQEQELSKEERRWIAYLIARYRVWNEAYQRIHESYSANNVPTLPLTHRIRSPVAAVFVSAVSLIAFSGVLWIARPEPTTIRDGVALLSVDSHGRITGGIDGYPELWREELRRILRTRSMPPPERAASNTRGSRPTMYIAPNSTTIRSTTPIFRWKSRGPGVEYRVIIYHEDTTITGDLCLDTHWSHEAPLRRGETYSWEVRVAQNGVELRPRESRPTFTVLSLENHKRLVTLEQQLPDSYLLRSLLYIQFNMIEAAEDELRALQNANPSSPLPNELLKSLESYQ